MTRTCHRCQARPGENSRGKPVCIVCQKLCTVCGQENDDLGYCRPCNRNSGRLRPMKVKDCVECGHTFRSKAASSYCPSCTHERQKHPCASCGTKVDRRATLCMRCWGDRKSGTNSPQYKTGRSRNKFHGYVLVSGYRDHPRQNNGYVREHVVVMEKLLGRYLLPNEQVHHLNGQRDDNRPENLELWTKSQPAGQRASDMVAWAKELLALYEPEALAQPVTPAA